MAYCKAHQLDMRGFCGKFDCPCIKHNCRFFGVKTNADRIRAMSDEELADTRIRYDPTRDMYISDRGAHYDFVSAMEEELEWLKQPAEE